VSYLRPIAIGLLQAPIWLYRLLIAPLLGPRCRFQPTCSAYALEALDRHGPLRGVCLVVLRLSRCHPWGGWGFDPVPDDSPVRRQRSA